LRPCRSLERRGCLFANLIIYVAFLSRTALAPLLLALCPTALSTLECLKLPVIAGAMTSASRVSFSNWSTSNLFHHSKISVALPAHFFVSFLGRMVEFLSVCRLLR
jgi:hypothetical protein